MNTALAYIHHPLSNTSLIGFHKVVKSLKQLQFLMLKKIKIKRLYISHLKARGIALSFLLCFRKSADLWMIGHIIFISAMNVWDNAFYVEISLFLSHTVTKLNYHHFTTMCYLIWSYLIIIYYVYFILFFWERERDRENHL